MSAVGTLGAGGTHFQAQLPGLTLQQPAGPAAQNGAGAAVQGMGGLVGRCIQQGDGQARSQWLDIADKAKCGFKTAGKIVGGIAASPLMLVAGVGMLATWGISKVVGLVNNKILEPRSDRVFQNVNPNLGLLTQPMSPHSVAQNDRILDKLETHAEQNKTPLTRQQIQAYVATGERIAHALREGQNTRPISIDIDGTRVQLESSVHTTRALSWFMMAQAARQDHQRDLNGDQSAIGDQTVTDMTSSGSFVMKDPGNRIYNFMAEAPTADSRMSTHFADRVGHDEKHKICGFIPSGKPSQRGIEDYRHMMPGQGGTILFDKLSPRAGGSEELFIKFESGGCPPYFRKEPHQGFAQGIFRFFSAIDRNIGHTFSFIGSKFQGKTDEMRRQEHVYKGTLKNDVAAPFNSIVKDAINRGIISASAKSIGASVQKFGLPFLKDALSEIEKLNLQSANPDLGLNLRIQNLKLAIDTTSDMLGAQSDHYGIERRGAESHISLDSNDNVVRVHAQGLDPKKAAEFQALVTAPSTSPPGTPNNPLSSNAIVDWRRSGITINGEFHAPLSPLERDHPNPRIPGAAQLAELVPPEMLTLISQYANQQTQFALVSGMQTGIIDIEAPNGKLVAISGTASSKYAIHVNDDRSATLSIEVNFGEDATVIYFDKPKAVDDPRMPAPMSPGRLQGEDAHASFRFGLTFSPEHTVSLSKPLQFDALIRVADAN